MFIKRNQLTRRKIVGGNLLGNLYNKAKDVLYNTSKLLLPKAKGIAKMTAQKALTTAKEQITPEKVFDLAQDVYKGDKKSVKKKIKKEVKQLSDTLSVDDELNPHARDMIKKLSQNKDVRKVLTNKSKELLKDNSRMILSNLMAGSGMKKC